MRVHHLRVTAFGPFAGTVEVDGDALGADGLFLLSGPTGAGKSSVLDAICFALYGAVPGRRNEARALRSDLAAPDVAPEVVLEVGLDGRRYRFTRSPAWERPKRRGTGTTTQQASVTVQRLDDDAWTPLTSRLDEAGDLVSRLLGMTCAQFCQVAMLPQGEFQTFLQARSDERQQVLARLFRTDRFDRIEAWLAEHRRTTRRVADDRARTLDREAHRLAEAGGVEPPGEDDDVTAWADALRLAAANEHDAAEAAWREADEALASTRDAAAAAHRLAEHQAAHADAVRRRDELAARAGEVAERRRRLDAAGRYAAVAGLDEVATRAARAVALAEAAGGADTDLPTTAAALDDATVRRDRLREASPLVAELAAARRAHAAAVRTREGLCRVAAEADVAADALPARVAALRVEVEAVAAQAARLDAARADLARSDEVGAAARRAVTVTAELAAARAGEKEARAVALTGKERWLAVREARVEGIAAELADALAVGQDCPVCGSCDHPRPATPTLDAVDRTDEQAARQALDTAETALEAHRDQVRGLERTLAALTATSGGTSPEEAERRVARDRAAADDARSATDALPALLQRLEAAEAEAVGAETTRRDTAARLASADADLAASDTLRTHLAARLDDLLGPQDAADPAAALRAAERDHERSEATHHAALRLAEARERAHLAADQAEASARAHRFADLAEARSARLDDATAARLRADEDAHRRAEHEVAARLADPALAAAATAPPADPAAADVRLAAATASADAAARRRTVAGVRRERLDVRAGELGAAVAALGPAVVAADRAAGLADLAAGRSADNRLRLSLAAYVLSWRLAQVVAAANVRLTRMTDGRFTLEHSPDTPVRGARRGGLELRVRDEWSGVSRSPVTLSGGETFVVSLALALGLADVVVAEADADAAGADIETLFVDEGFGSLDADTLDDVMDVLDELRSGGRVVGVVSHVAGMRERIGTRLDVTPGAGGSRLRLVQGA